MIDSSYETKKHIHLVQDFLEEFSLLLKSRGRNHDKTKLGSFEKPYFDEFTEKLPNLTYGSEEYKQSLENLKPALEHHYKNNSHHPESRENGIDGMDLLDIVEMLYDWLAATKRHTDGDIYKSLVINKDRFNMSDQLYNIFKNTIDRYKF